MSDKKLFFVFFSLSIHKGCSADMEATAFHLLWDNTVKLPHNAVDERGVVSKNYVIIEMES